ncbi:MAG: hypothetical protein RMK29_00325 [Myxococcales bacterium]|nr:hypothetical protein [Myxococcota bacterium]MDW8280121.1 hypothetical protein [Myxococcales bacterium]
MRLIALCALLAVAAPGSLCERRNPQVCREQDPALACAPGLVCRRGRCQEPECTDHAGCRDGARPICSQHICVGCESDAQCRQRDPTAPFCQSGRCVACARAADCSDGLRPICDAQSGTCRACLRHSECAPGVCAKDSLLSDLPGPLAIPAGSCVPPERVLVVDAARCVPPHLCSAREALDRVSPMQPYIVLRSGQGAMFTDLAVPGPNNTSGLRVVHLIGPMADTPPTQARTRPVTLGSPLSRALLVRSGHHLVVEGLHIEGGVTGVECAGMAQPEATRLEVLRSVIGNTEVGILANRCHVVIQESWIGAGFPPLFGGMLGNRLALKLVNTRFVIENVVLFRNGLLGFGGIDLVYDPMWQGGLSYIVNSTIAHHSAPSASGAVSLECNTSVTDHLVVFNTFIYNDLLRWEMHPTRHIAPACRPQVSALATNDPDLARESSDIVLVRTDAEAGLSDPRAGNLRLRADAPTSIAEGGVQRFERGSVEIVAPRTDIEGTPRGQRRPGHVSIGSFEAPGP